MPFITKDDLGSHLYEESIAVITRGNDALITDAINTAMRQATGYLSKYDTEEIFATTGDDRAIYADLITYIKDLAKWHLLAACNANVDLELAESRYKSALAELGKIQAGKVVPLDWPVITDDAVKPFRAGSNKKFNHS